MKNLLVSIALLLAWGAQAEELTIRASPVCGDWSKARQADNGRGALVQSSWLLGYLSGIAMGSETNVLKNAAPNEALFLWMDRYCVSYPTHSVGEGANVLYWELLRKAPK